MPSRCSAPVLNSTRERKETFVPAGACGREVAGAGSVLVTRGKQTCHFLYTRPVPVQSRWVPNKGCSGIWFVYMHVVLPSLPVLSKAHRLVSHRSELLTSLFLAPAWPGANSYIELGGSAS